MENGKQLREERKSLILDMEHEAQAIKASGLPMSAEQAERFDNMEAKAADLLQRAESAERIERITDLAKPEIKRSEVFGAPVINVRSKVTEQDFNNAFKGWMLRGKNESVKDSYKRSADALGINIDSKEFALQLPQERALSSVTNTAGEYTIGEQWASYVDRKLKSYAGIRNYATILRTDSGETYHLPCSDDTSNVGALLAENTAAGEQDIAFTEKQLGSYKYTSKYVKVPVELVEDSRVNIVSFVMDALTERIGRKIAADYTSGTGSSQPQGVVGAATAGVTLASGETDAADITMDDLIDLIHSVDPSYRASDKCAFMLHDTMLAALKKMKVGTSDARALWLPSHREGEPGTLLGFPVIVNQHMATYTGGAGTAPVLFGDFSKFWIRDVGEFRMRRFDELNGLSDQLTFVGFFRTDSELMSAGAPISKLVTAAE